MADSDVKKAQGNFKKFAKGTGGMTSKECTDWFKNAGLLSGPGKKCTSNDLDIQFSAAKGKGPFNEDKVEALVDKMKKSYALDHKMSEDEAKTKICCELAKAENKKTGTKVSATGGVDRMTDTSKYTGAHKERFDKDGKGKGASGRTDSVENTGYVGNYKGAGTYDKKK